MTEKEIQEATKREYERQLRLGLHKPEKKIELLPADYHIGKFCCPTWK